MSHQLWSTVESYLNAALLAPDPLLEAVLESIRAAGMPEHSVAPAEGKLLHLLVRLSGARRILELGTLGGYSSIWLARALPPDGRLITLESEPRHGKLAAANIAKAGLSHCVDLRLGRAIETLALLEMEGAGPFDFIFIDADKPSNPDYLRWALRLSRPGTLIIVDNVVRHGAVTDVQSHDPNVQGMRHMFELIAAEPRLDATALQTVCGKGHDGMCIMLVNS